MSRKRSFFERLTGSVSIPDDDDALSLEGSDTPSAAHPWLDEPEEGELAVDVYQTPSEIIIRTMVSGVKPEDLNISITRDMVTIKGRRETQREVSDEDYFHRELYWGSFARTILLPAEVEVEESEAVEKHGLLTIRLPKIDKDRSSNLKVKSVT
jgi:HSP20 family protein